MIKRATQDKMPILLDIADTMGQGKDTQYFDLLFEKQQSGTVDIFHYHTHAYAVLNYDPKYKYYKLHSMPEIQDLNVKPDHRRNGYGRALITHCENTAKHKGYKNIGISVGLTPDYGAAQILYARMGYLPDGHGITHDRAYVRRGDVRTIDDDLCLMLEKEL